jgi:(p)ppGpp synthase/HD superfamily hydrolase
MNLGITYALVADVFKDTTDKSGRPYFEHCLWVASKMDTDEEKMIALLHDVVEDTKDKERPITLDTLRSMGYSEEVVRNVDVLTHNPEDDYETIYIRRIAMYPKAKKAKLADLEHNSQVTRLKGLRQKDFVRLEKYLRSYVYLKN